MAISPKTIKRRIRSVGNTKKITKAMEMVAAAKMRKAVNAVTASRAYANTAWALVLDLITKTNRDQHPLLTKPAQDKPVAIILFSSNRGLCGGFNARVLGQANAHSGELTAAGLLNQQWVSIGKKGSDYLAKTGKEIVADFEKPDAVVGTADVAGIVSLAVNDFLAGKYAKVVMVYTDFVSALVQQPRVKQLLPLEAGADQNLGSTTSDLPDKAESNIFEYLFEPDPRAVLDNFLPRLVEVQVYQAMLESIASEHSARMMAMRNATDSAQDMINELTLIYNQARQAAITKEIAEISGGKAALEN